MLSSTGQLATSARAALCVLVVEAEYNGIGSLASGFKIVVMSSWAMVGTLEGFADRMCIASGSDD